MGAGAYTLLPLQDWLDESERPLTLELPNGCLSVWLKPRWWTMQLLISS
jgi:hypothetical protein